MEQTQQLIDIVVEGGLASEEDLAAIQRRIEGAGRTATPAEVLQALVDDGVVTHRQAERIGEKIESSHHGSPSSRRNVVRAFCAQCRQVVAVADQGVLPPCPTCGKTLVYPDQTIRAPGQPAVADPFEGMQIEGGCGTYRIIEKMGAGGFSAVYRAQLLDDQADEGYDRALKVLHPHLVGQQRDVDDFFAEVRTLQQISHPSVVRVYESGLVDGVPFTVMDLIKGQSLKEALDDRGEPLEVSTALTIAAQVASALREVHQAGLIHRDVKPGNIMVRNEDAATTVHAILLDFGIARVADGLGGDMRTYAGTKHYEAPEQEQGEPETASDIWAMGVVIYQMLNARSPHVPPAGASSSRRRAPGDRRANPYPFDKLEIAHSLQSEIETLTKSCLRLSPHRRPTAEKLCGELERLRAKALTLGDGAESGGLLRGKRGVALAAGVVVLAAAIALPLWLSRKSKSGADPSGNATTTSAESTEKAAAKTAASEAGSDEPSYSNRAAEKIEQIHSLREAGRLAEAFRAIDDLRVLDPARHPGEERQTAEALKEKVRSLVSSCAFSEALAAAKEVMFDREELATELTAQVEADKRRFCDAAQRSLGTPASWPQCGELVRKAYAAAVATGSLDRARAILAAFSSSGDTYQDWVRRNLDKTALEKATREIASSSRDAVRAIMSALAAGPDQQVWQTATATCQALGQHDRSSTATALRDICSRGTALSKSYTILDQSIREAMGAQDLKQEDMRADAARLKQALEGEVRAKAAATRGLLDDLTRKLNSLPSLQTGDVRRFEDELRSRDPAEFLRCLEKAHSGGTSIDRGLWVKTWSSYCDLKPPPLRYYYQKAIAYRDAGQSEQALAARLARIADLCARGEFQEAFAAIDELRGANAGEADDRERVAKSAVESKVAALLKAKSFAEARSLADSVARIRPQLAQALKSTTEAAEWSDAHAAAKSTIESERSSPRFSKTGWERALAACKQLAGKFAAKPEAAALLDDCTFYMTEAETRDAAPAARWKSWKTFLAQNPRSAHADDARRQQDAALEQGRRDMAEALSAIRKIRDSLDAQSGDDPRALLAASDRLKRELSQKVDLAQQISTAFNQEVQLDRATIARIEARLAFETFRARAATASEPERAEIWRQYFDEHGESMYAGQAQEELVRLLAADINPICHGFDEQTKEAPDEATYAAARERLSKASRLAARYQELFGHLRGFDISSVNKGVKLREQRLAATLVINANTRDVEVSINGRRVDGAVPISYSYAVAGCSYTIKARKPGWKPYAQDVKVAETGETTVEIVLEQLQPRLPLGLDATVWQVPDKDADQYGNPVVTRDDCRCDPETKLSYEIWLSRVELRGLIRKERIVLGPGWMEFVLVPAGKYIVSSLGDEWRKGFIGGEGLPIMPPYVLERSPNMEPVVIERPIYLSKYEITTDQFKPYDTWKGRYLKSEAGDHPAYPVSWANATKLCEKLSETTGAKIKLPTDAEWESACRAGATTLYAWGDEIDPKFGNFPIGTARGRPRRVGSFAPNPFGFYDMIGSVREWCAEDRHWSNMALCRGGDFMSPSIALTNHFRYLGRQDSKKGIRGCRICLVP